MQEGRRKTVTVVAGVDLGGTAVNYTLVDGEEKFLIEGLCEHPALAKQGPAICLQQIADGLKIATDKAGVQLADVVAVGLDTPGPASAGGQFSARGSTNFVHADWAGFDIREGLAHKLGMPVSYLNDANAAALWGHYAIFGVNSRETSISIGQWRRHHSRWQCRKGEKRFWRRTGARADPVSKHRRGKRH
jgi:glucokinase